MKNSNEKSFKSIIIYQSPLFYRVLMAVIAIAFTAFAIYCIYDGKGIMTIILLTLCLYVVFYIIGFGRYYRLDVKSNQFVSSVPFVKEKFDLDNVICIKLSAPESYGWHIDFSVNIQDKSGNVCVLTDWVWSFTNRNVFTSRSTIKRLQKFCDKCNQYLNSRQK